MSDTINLIKTAFGLDDTISRFVAIGWSRSMATMPNTLPDNLGIKSLLESAEFCKLDDQIKNDIFQAYNIIMTDSNLKSLMWHTYFQLVEDRFNLQFAKWPTYFNALESLSNMIYLIAALASVPIICKSYQRFDIPEIIIQDTCQQVKCFANNHKTFFDGRSGIDPVQLFWFTHYIDARLFRIGRFEYKLKQNNLGVIVCRNHQGELILLAANNWSFDKDGFFANEDSDKSSCWQSSLKLTNDFIEGYIVSPRGFAINKKISLSSNQWDVILDDNSWFLDLHIPSGGDMSMDSCYSSIRDAFKFFKKHFPDCRADAVMCWSWIFNTQLEELLPNSNLAKFIQTSYVFPADSTGDDGMNFIFGSKTDDLSVLPKKSSLQKAMISVLEQGNQLRSGGMYLHSDDLERAFANQIYRVGFDKLIKQL